MARSDTKIRITAQDKTRAAFSSTKATLQRFHGFITRDKPMEMLFQ